MQQMAPIVFISRLGANAQQRWLTLLRQYLPDETFLVPRQLNDDLSASVTIAIVADPEPAMLTRYPNLVWIQSLWAGVERLVAALPNRQIKLVRLIDPQLAQTMAESVLAWTLYLHKNMPEYAHQQHDKQWQPLPVSMATDIRVGILGAGELGLAAINLLKNVGYRVSCWSRTAKIIPGIRHFTGQTELAVMLAESDILVCLLPLTPYTHKLLNAAVLRALPEGAKLINFSRGAVLDTPALVALLDSGHLAHAVLDVFEQEPLPAAHPLWHHPNVTVLPHISAPTNPDSAAKIVAENIKAYRCNGEVPDAIDPGQGY